MSALTSWNHPWSRWVARIGRLTRRHAAPLTMVRLRYGYLPAQFFYAGAEHRVRRVERSWEEAAHNGVAQRCFQVHCSSGRRYTIAQNLNAGNWQVVDPL